MKKCLIALVVSAILGFILPWIVSEPLLSNMFTVSGVIFSVGMSLVVTMNTQHIHQPQAKSMAQETINNLLRNYIVCFLISTFCFSITMMFRETDNEAFRECSFTLFKHDFCFNYPLSVLLYLGYSICYYIYNMWSTRKQHYEIERQIDEEMKEDE